MTQRKIIQLQLISGIEDRNEESHRQSNGINHRDPGLHACDQDLKRQRTPVRPENSSALEIGDLGDGCSGSILAAFGAF